MQIHGPHVWVFNGGGGFPSGVFTSREKAEAWIVKHKLGGTLSAYPLDTGAWDYGVEQKLFTVKRPQHQSPAFIARFSAGWVHFHYADGNADGPNDDGVPTQLRLELAELEKRVAEVRRRLSSFGDEG